MFLSKSDVPVPFYGQTDWNFRAISQASYGKPGNWSRKPGFFGNFQKNSFKLNSGALISNPLINEIPKQVFSSKSDVPVPFYGQTDWIFRAIYQAF